MTTVRTIAQALAVPLVLLVAVMAQLAVVNRAPLPGGTGPDLVLLVVTAVAVRTGPMVGMLTGFAGGLALDVAPPASHLAGEYALVFCVAGYACGRARNAIVHATGEMTMVAALTVMVLGTAAGEAGKAALGRLVSDPDVTGQVIRHVLPGAIVYDLVLCPFVLWLVSLMLRRPAPERAPRPELTHIAGAFRIASAGSAGAIPRLRLAGSTPPPVRPRVRSEPKLRLTSGSSSPLSGTYAAFSPAHPPVPGGRPLKLNFGQATPGSPRPRPPASPGKGWLRAASPARDAALKRASPGQGWLRAQRRAVPPPRRTSPGKNWIRARPPAAAVAPRTSLGKNWIRARPPAAAAVPRPALRKGWIRARRPAATAVPRPALGKNWIRARKPAFALRRTSNGNGWLYAQRPGVVPVPRRASPGKGWIRPAKPVHRPRRKSPGRGWLRPAKPAPRNWYGRSPSTRWVRRSHSPWRGRRRRLFSLVGGRR
jgi:rod shape-determining protein MreD